MRRLSMLAVVALMSACPVPPGPPDADPHGDPLWPADSVEVGIPSSDFDPSFHAWATPLELHPGAQGGYHAPILYRVRNHQQTAANFAYRVTRSRDGVLVSQGSRVYDIVPTEGVWTSDSPITVFLCPTPVGLNISGEELTFDVTLTTQDQTLLNRATVNATVVCPANNSSCESLCRG